MSQVQIINGVTTHFIDLDHPPTSIIVFKVGDKLCLYRMVGIGGHRLSDLAVPDKQFAMDPLMFTMAPLRVGQPNGAEVAYLGFTTEPGAGAVIFNLTPMAPGSVGVPFSFNYVVN